VINLPLLQKVSMQARTKMMKWASLPLQSAKEHCPVCFLLKCWCEKGGNRGKWGTAEWSTHVTTDAKPKMAIFIRKYWSPPTNTVSRKSLSQFPEGVPPPSKQRSRRRSVACNSETANRDAQTAAATHTENRQRQPYTASEREKKRKRDPGRGVREESHTDQVSADAGGGREPGLARPEARRDQGVHIPDQGGARQRTGPPEGKGAEGPERAEGGVGREGQEDHAGDGREGRQGECGVVPAPAGDGQLGGVGVGVPGSFVPGEEDLR